MLLLACSGGSDSVALFYLLKNGGFNFQVAHVNYQLRSDESDRDEQFVKDLCLANGIAFLSKKVFELDQSKSIQEEARAIRYAFFDELVKNKGFDYILTAHHQGDLVENLLFRVMRGSGLKGLVTFTEKQGHLIRPLLSFSKEDIKSYLLNKEYLYREDSSNASNKYARNSIRNQILPLMEDSLPNIHSRITKTKELLSNDYELIMALLETYEKRLHEGRLTVSFDDKKAQLPSFWHYLMGVNLEEARQIAEAVTNKKNGFSIEFDDIQIATIQNKVEISKGKIWESESVFISEPKNRTITLGNECISLKFDKAKELNFQENSCIINADNLVFPLCIRSPKTGDKFQPLGMTGSKLLSDFYNDLGISALDKPKQWLIEDANEQILAVLPFRVDEKYKAVKDSQSNLWVKLWASKE